MPNEMCMYVWRFVRVSFLLSCECAADFFTKQQCTWFGGHTLQLSSDGAAF